jgi:hypothetical protein
MLSAVVLAGACNLLLDNETRGVAPPAAEAGADASDSSDGKDGGSSEDANLDVRVVSETCRLGDGGIAPTKGLVVCHPIGTGSFVVQCFGDGTDQDVWQALGQGPSIDSRFAEYKYPQTSETFLTCKDAGAKDPTGHFPIVFTSSTVPDSLPEGTLVASCVGPGTSDTYAVKIAAPVQSHPAAYFVKTEPYAACP